MTYFNVVWNRMALHLKQNDVSFYHAIVRYLENYSA